VAASTSRSRERHGLHGLSIPRIAARRQFGLESDQFIDGAPQIGDTDEHPFATVAAQAPLELAYRRLADGTRARLTAIRLAHARPPYAVNHAADGSSSNFVGGDAAAATDERMRRVSGHGCDAANASVNHPRTSAFTGQPRPSWFGTMSELALLPGTAASVYRVVRWMRRRRASFATLVREGTLSPTFDVAASGLARIVSSPAVRVAGRMALGTVRSTIALAHRDVRYVALLHEAGWIAPQRVLRRRPLDRASD
jgi:hypothetical protein